MAASAGERGRLWNFTCLLISIILAGFDILTWLLLSRFFANNLVPISVDRRPEWHNPPCIGGSPLINNLFFISLFSVQHSAMQRGPLKRVLSLVVPEDYYRQFYSVMASLAVVAIIYFWHPMPTVVWEVTNETLKTVISVVNSACGLGVVISLLTLDPFMLLGVREPFYRMMGWKDDEPVKLVTTGIYGISRHPVYCTLMLAIWIVPKMTIGYLLIATMLTLYIVVATIYYEEPDLIKVFGDSYVKYKQKTAMFYPIPFLTPTAGTKKD